MKFRIVNERTVGESGKKIIEKLGILVVIGVENKTICITRAENSTERDF